MLHKVDLMRKMYTQYLATVRIPLENKYQHRSRKQVQATCRFCFVERRLSTAVRCTRSKVRCSRTVHSDSATRLSGFRPVGLTL